MVVKKRQKALSSGRPPIAKERERMSSKQSRTIIRTHHQLQKEHAAAVKKGDTKAADDLEKRIENNGGIKVYQAASKQGQAKTRGGDSSKLLVEWLREAKIIRPNGHPPKAPHRLLEVGALSTENEISKFPKTIEVTRIDLNSQGPGITQQDFMERPLPTGHEDQFDIISLSLVLNYVPEPVGRGDMLKRVTQFLRRLPKKDEIPVLPALFFVLPLPCVANSRYLNEEVLLELMDNMGFEMKFKNVTPKLCYYLFTLVRHDNGAKSEKRKIRDGHAMNNFCIIIE